MEIDLALDAIIISDSGVDSVSGTNPLRLTLDGRTADIQVVQNYLTHQGQIQTPIDGDGEMSWASAPKLNGIYLFNYLTKHDFEVGLINSFYEQKDQFRRYLNQTPRAVIISTTFMVGKPSLCKLVDDIRNLAPDITIITGGPFVYLSYLLLQRSREPDYDTVSARDDFLFLSTGNEPAVDCFVVSLRGEQILCKALHNLKDNRSIHDLPNTAHLEGNSYRFSPRIDDISTAENFYIDWKSLPDSIFQHGVVPMQASIGCPYDCAFCNFTKDHRLTYITPIDQLIAELKAVSGRGARYVWFVDDNFRLGKGDLNAICQRMLDEDLNLKWMTFIRASTLKTVDVELLRRAGCTEVQLGLESADPKMLEHMKKQADPDLYDEVLQKLLSGGINCSCYFIIGFPGETLESVQRTREFIASHQYAEFEGNLAWSIYPFLLTPLSPIYEPALRKKYDLSGYMHNWEHRTMNSDLAKMYILQTFFEIENSGPIYRGDNQDIFHQIGPQARKKFEVTRHLLSKAAVSGQLNKHDIIHAFDPLITA